MHNEIDSGELVADSLEVELVREVSEGHSLHGRPTTAVGFMQKCPNDFLYEIHDQPGAFAWVHLTWQCEASPDFPMTEIYEDWNEFLERAPKAG